MKSKRKRRRIPVKILEGREKSLYWYTNSYNINMTALLKTEITCSPMPMPKLAIASLKR
jgi:hypothetical protein